MPSFKERSDVKIKHCFWLKNGLCVSSEIYRFNPEVERTGKCPYNPEDTAFLESQHTLRCLEFRHVH